MSPVYTVVSVEDQVRDWAYKNGTKMRSYRVALRNERGKELAHVEWSREADVAPPKPGDTTPDGSSVDPDAPYGPKLVVPKRGGAGGGGGYRGKPVEERRSIAMQHAQKCAVTILQASGPEFAVTTQDVVDTAWVLFRQVMAAETTDRPAT